MSIREFSTSANANLSSGEGDIGEDKTLKIDGKPYVFHAPTSSQLAMIIYGSQAKLTESVAAFVNFFFGTLDSEHHNYFRSRLWDRNDRFDDGMVADIVKHLIEEWTGNPTQQSSGSTVTPPDTGQTSTATVPSEA